MGLTTLSCAIDLLGIGIIVVLAVNAYRKKEILGKTYSTYFAMLINLGVTLVTDIILYLVDGRIFFGSNLINNVVSCLHFITIPVSCMLWCMFVCFKIDAKRTKNRLIQFLFVLPILINLILSLLSIPFDIYYTISPLNVYARGKLYYASIGISFSYIILALILLLIRRKSIDKNTFVSLICFPIIPVLAAIGQTLFYGGSLIWSFFALGLLMEGMWLNSEFLFTDALTQLNNRHAIISFLNKKLNKKQYHKFVGIFFDIDKFKDINDTNGHLVGDEALKDVAQILKDSITKDTFLARYGGDEFVAFLDIEKEKDVAEILENVNKKLVEFNSGGDKPYTLAISAGYELFDVENRYNYEEVLKFIDAKMYKSKNKKD